MHVPPVGRSVEGRRNDSGAVNAGAKRRAAQVPTARIHMTEQRSDRRCMCLAGLIAPRPHDPSCPLYVAREQRTSDLCFHGRRVTDCAPCMLERHVGNMAEIERMRAGSKLHLQTTKALALDNDRLRASLTAIRGLSRGSGMPLEAIHEIATNATRRELTDEIDEIRNCE